jgi:hypothetical protein
VSRNFAANYSPNVDILFMIDDSSSMKLAQDNLRAAFPTFVAALQALPGGLPSVHIAVVSQDMGAGDGSISGCESDESGNVPAGKKGIFQYRPGGTCTATNLAAGATYISNVAGVANYTGPLETVLSCIAALGESGCGFEHQFAAVLRALGADGRGAAPAENQGFLRIDAPLVIIMLTNEDDCSAAPGVPLFDTNANQNVGSQLGPPANFRCNEFGHTCMMGSGSPMHPNRLAPNNDVTATVSYDTCVSNDTEGYLLSSRQTADALKALKDDPAHQIAVVSIQGAPTPYTVHWKNPSTSDTSCSTNGQQCPWPEITHSCTASSGNFGDPGVRTAQFIQEFGANGLVASVCDASYAPALQQTAALIGTMTGPPCLTALLADDPKKPGQQPECSVTLHQLKNGAYVDSALPGCADNGNVAPCWTLSPGVATCSGFAVSVLEAAATATARDTVTFECVACPPGSVSGSAGCL